MRRRSVLVWAGRRGPAFDSAIERAQDVAGNGACADISQEGRVALDRGAFRGSVLRAGERDPIDTNAHAGVCK